MGNKILDIISNILTKKNDRLNYIKGTTKLPDAQPVEGELKFNIIRVIKWTLFVLALVALLSFRYTKPNMLPKLNEVAKYDILAPYQIKIIDEKATDKMKEEIIKSVTDKYKFDKNISREITRNINELFVFIKETKKENEKKALTDDIIERKINNYKISFKSFKYALTLSNEVLDKLNQGINSIFETVLSVEVPVEKIHVAKSEAMLKLKVRAYDEEELKMMYDIFEQYIRPNYVYNKEATQKERDRLVANAVPIERLVAEGEIIVRHGEIVKQEHIDIFKKYNFYETNNHPTLNVLSSCLISFFSIIVVILYLIQNKNEIFKQEALLTMLAIIVMSILVIARIVNFINFEKMASPFPNSTENSFFSPYIIPTSASAILIALLIDTKLAFIVNIIIVILVDLILGHNNSNFLIVNIFSGIVAILNVKTVNQRSDLTKAGIMVSFSNIFLITAYALWEYNVINMNYYSNLMRDAVWGFFNGFISAIFAIGMLPYLESIFKVSTSMRLLELSDLNQSLLRRLLLEAPGTYHHSMIVGNLAEAAAKDIGADALLCRVAAYYHDIGKLKRPLFFVENQNSGPNVHDTIKPNLSAKVIMSHTKDGYEIGMENQLPQEILNIIMQHHGTNLISYFYIKAINKFSEPSKDEHVESEYRYSGPKPQSREAAIILLADAVEAASRALSKPSASSIKSLVKKIQNERFTDGQFDECNITLKDLETISNTFIRIIMGMYHSRIEYPENEKANANKGPKLNFNDEPDAQNNSAPATENSKAENKVSDAANLEKKDNREVAENKEQPAASNEKQAQLELPDEKNAAIDNKSDDAGAASKNNDLEKMPSSVLNSTEGGYLKDESRNN
ncbi:MAG: HDIG domain-containing protein [Candidatus Wallbacteria bacterium]